MTFLLLLNKRFYVNNKKKLIMNDDDVQSLNVIDSNDVDQDKVIEHE